MGQYNTWPHQLHRPYSKPCIAPQSKKAYKLQIPVQYSMKTVCTLQSSVRKVEFTQYKSFKALRQSPVD